MQEYLKMTRCIRFSYFSGGAVMRSGNIYPLPIITLTRASTKIKTRKTAGNESKIA